MPKHDLNGKKIAILATNGYEQVELVKPRKAIEEAGGKAVIVAPQSGTIRGWDSGEWADRIKVDVEVAQADPNEYDGLLLPGGVINPDRLRRDEKAVAFVRAFFDAGKPVAAICHGPQTMIDAGVVEGRRMTSFHAIRRDLENAGADWVDEEVVVDQGLVTSRKPSDVEAFSAKMVEEFAEGVHAGQHA